MSAITIGSDGTPVIAPITPWYRKPITWALALVLTAGLAAGLWFGVFAGHGASSPVGILQRDGYVATENLTPSQMDKLGMFSGDSSIMKPYVVSMAVGTKANGQSEGVVQLNDSGRTFIGALLPTIQSSMPKGETFRIDGNFAIVSGPASMFTQT